MDKKNITVYVLIAIFVFIVLGILQVIYIRFKFDTFSKQRITTDLNIEDQIVKNCPKNNLYVFNIQNNQTLTLDINKSTSEPYTFYVKDRRKEVFLPFSCSTTNRSTNSIKGIKTILKNPVCICINKTETSFALQNIIQSHPQIYLIVNNSVCIADIDQYQHKELKTNYPDYENVIILNLYCIIDQPEYMEKDNTSEAGCSLLNINTFYGNMTRISYDQLPEYLCILSFGTS